jgi:GrpB-like predicted nucleotidyltransferase (UPF0157 family)
MGRKKKIPEPDFWIDHTTPFYETQPTAQLKAVAKKETAKLEEAAAAAGITFCRGPVHIGSSAIEGMCGSAMVDLAVEVPDLNPPPPALLEALTAAGYEYRGSSPHHPEDHWAMGGEGAKGTLGRATLHLTPFKCGFIDDALQFVTYLSKSPFAYQEYFTVKLEGARNAFMGVPPLPDGVERWEGTGDDPHRDYKMHKKRVVDNLLDEAKIASKIYERQAEEQDSV